MRSLKFVIPLLVAVAASIGSGFLQGSLSHRWSPPPDYRAFKSALDGIPTELGDWVFQREEEMPDRVVRMLHSPSYINRVYTHKESSESLILTVLVGEPGSLSRHTPEICYSQSEYNVISKPTLQSIRETQRPAESFHVMTLQARNLRGDMLRVFYAWNRGADWEAPKDARFLYGGEEILMKLQLAGMARSETLGEAGDPCRDFLAELLPHLDPIAASLKKDG